MAKRVRRSQTARHDDTFKNFVLDQLAELPGLSCRAMFGGFGLYRGPAFFGIIHRGRLFLKTDETTRTRFTSRKMKPFRPNRKQTLKSYYEVPPDILEDPDALASWADEAAAR